MINLCFSSFSLIYMPALNLVNFYIMKYRKICYLMGFDFNSNNHFILYFIIFLSVSKIGCIFLKHIQERKSAPTVSILLKDKLSPLILISGYKINLFIPIKSYWQIIYCCRCIQYIFHSEQSISCFGWCKPFQIEALQMFPKFYSSGLLATHLLTILLQYA